jgi:hypothetical protein
MSSNHIARAASGTTPWIERLARVGYFAIGAVYIIAGGLTAVAALGNRGNTTDRKDALTFIVGQPFGKAILALMAMGLAGYSIWRILSALVDSDRRGSDAKGIGARIAAFLSGVFYGALTIEVVRLLRNRSGGGDDEAAAAHWTARALDLPFGNSLVAIAGMVIFVVGVYQIGRGWKADLSKRLRLSTLQPATRTAVVTISRFGLAARGVVFCIIGASVVTAALRSDPGEARGLSGAFASLTQQPFGHALLAAVAIGFVAYGIYAIVNGMYRSIDAQ